MSLLIATLIALLSLPVQARGQFPGCTNAFAPSPVVSGQPWSDTITLNRAPWNHLDVHLWPIMPLGARVILAEDQSSPVTVGQASAQQPGIYLMRVVRQGSIVCDEAFWIVAP